MSNIVNSCLQDYIFNFKIAYNDEPSSFILPTNDKDIIAFVYNLLYRFNARTLNFYEFLKVYYHAETANGTEFGEYVASKGGVLAYTKWTAKQVAQYGATCNSLSFGGVLSEINKPVIDNPALWQQIMDLTPLKRWATVEEAAEQVQEDATQE